MAELDWRDAIGSPGNRTLIKINRQLNTVGRYQSLNLRKIGQ